METVIVVAIVVVAIVSMFGYLRRSFKAGDACQGCSADRSKCKGMRRNGKLADVNCSKDQ